jgi:hypothetical protein
VRVRDLRTYVVLARLVAYVGTGGTAAAFVDALEAEDVPLPHGMTAWSLVELGRLVVANGPLVGQLVRLCGSSYEDPGVEERLA